MNIRKSTLALLGSTIAGTLAFACAGADSDASSDADLAASKQTVVISQVFTTGGVSDTRPKADFLELHNRSNEPVKLAGLGLQFAGADTQFDAKEVFALDASAVLPPGGFYLLQLKSGAKGTKLAADAEIADLDLPISGSVALVKKDSPLDKCDDAEACAKNAAMARSLVGYGRAATAEGTPVANDQERLKTSEVLVRKDDGCASSMNNAADFLFGKPEGGYGKRNASSAGVVCPQFKGTNTNTNTSTDGGAANDPDGSTSNDTDGGANGDGGSNDDGNDNGGTDAGTTTDAGASTDAGAGTGTGTGNGNGPGKVTPSDDDDGADAVSDPTVGKKKKTGLEAALGNQPIASSSKSTCAMGSGPATSNALAGLAGLGLALAAMGRRRAKK